MIAYKYRIYPNQAEQQKLNRTLDLCRFTHNKLLEELNKQEKINRGLIQHKIVELKHYIMSSSLYSYCYILEGKYKGGFFESY